MNALRDATGAPATLGKRIGDGGEGAVYRILERPQQVAKIYAKPMSREQLAKLAAMVRASDEGLHTVAAWPTGLVFDGPRPVGFTMPLLSAQRPLHELLGPRSRQEHFPGAQWKFLIHTGANLARAFAVLHERGVVVGDVNSNNVVVGADSTARLIDCDSFQVRTSSGLYRCRVGVPDYQPPELQSADFASLERLPQHDRFGLAVMLFQLLFVGKHPFAGVLPPGVAGNGAIGANVAARRFFYDPHARRRGMRPPPGSPTLGAVSPEVAALFTRAFLGDPAQRPSASDWCAALETIETQTTRCSRNAAHQHLRGAACPWCALDRTGLHYFTLPGQRERSYGVDESIWQRCTSDDVARMWAEIAAIRAPAPVESTLRVAKTYRATPLRLWKPARIAAYVAGTCAAASAVAIAFAARVPLVAFLIGVGAVALGAAFRPDARSAIARAWRRSSQARAAYNAAANAWQREARGTRFLEAREQLARVRARLSSGRRRHDAEVAALQRRRDQLEWERFAASRTLAVCRVGDRRIRAYLAGQGILHAGQISNEALRRVPGLSRAWRAALVRWRESVELEFLRKPKAPPDPKAMHLVKLRFARERARDQHALAEGASTLRRLSAEIYAKRAQLRATALSRLEALRQAEAETKISPLLYKTWT